MHQVENFIDKHAGSGEANISRLQHRDAVLAGNAVEIGKVGNQKLPQTAKLANQIPAAHFGLW